MCDVMTQSEKENKQKQYFHILNVGRNDEQ